MISRRRFLKSSGALVAAGSLTLPQSQHIVVVGAGVFGGWTALSLLRKGMRVTLIDAWGPGHSRASTGGETRVIRASYGDQRIYVDLVARALELWRENVRWALYEHDAGCLLARRPVTRKAELSGSSP